MRLLILPAVIVGYLFMLLGLVLAMTVMAYGSAAWSFLLRKVA